MHAFQSLAALSAAVEAGDLTPREIVDAYLERIARYDQKLHAFVSVYADEARAAADAAGEAIRSGHRIGPLHGLPIALKDLVDLEGRITTGGSAVWRERVSPATAVLADRLIAAGMIVIGKTHTVEFAMGGWGTNEHMGTPWNPWDDAVQRIPGGSSAGSGVSVGAGLAPSAIGTDTGGSVRLPAAFCGHVGLKVTIGRIPTLGVLPLSHTLDTPGPMTRTVEDAALLYRVLQGPDAREPRTQGLAYEDPMPTLKRGVAGLRLAAMPSVDRMICDAEVLAAYDASLETFRQLGATVEQVALPYRLMDLGMALGRIIGGDGYYHVGALVDDLSLPIDPAVRPRIWIGKDMPATEYIAALDEQQRIKREFAETLAGYDALLTPTTATAAIPVAAVDQMNTPAVLTRFVNLIEGCACVLPNGFTGEGLPTSLQIVCPGEREAMALRIGHAFEAATDFGGRVPPTVA
ncbi:MAG: amidase [Alphaproteobacteria bacterium]|nr:amidase [Alphaproteobacteria bacterium]MCB9929771.1 amidase [Alphaproteobacteria bacterium]